jgi:ribosomal protein L37AE/L43A
MIESFLFPELFRKIKPVSIMHQQTCPECGRTLVNVYKRDGAWKCAKCWDKPQSKTEA